MTDYAIVVLSLMARESERTFAAAEVAERSGIAAPTVSKLLKSMTRAQIVSSVRGAKGGYRLARPPEKMSVASIIDALEGPISITECGVAHDSCQQSHSCHIRGNWNVINRAVRTALESVTLIDMVKPRHAGGEEAVVTLTSLHHPTR
jgi:FeS assembly SUF system regulator